tara:strand:- start:1095 stop:1760 length:666 start_codon:yes stop_codon:yes gene_type:complete
MDIHDYKTIIFDCDGVILNSNKIKSEAFRIVASQYGDKEARKLVTYNKENGGVSRYVKFNYFINEIITTKNKLNQIPNIDYLLNQFSKNVVNGLNICELVKDLGKLKKASINASWMVISGGDQSELRQVFNKRDLTKFFDKGIFGSPVPKDEIFKREIEKGSIIKPALFIGDSKFDYECSINSGIDFVFAHQWTEFNDWKEFCSKNKIKTIDYVTNLTGIV